MLVSVDLVDVETDHVDHFYNDLLQTIFQFSAIDEALILVQVHGKYTILCDFITPKGNNLRHWVFLQSCH